MRQTVKLCGRKVKFRFLVFISIILFILGYVIMNNSKITYASIVYGELLINDTGTLIIIRQEDVLDIPSYKKIDYHVVEGETVYAEQHIATLYKDDLSLEILNDLYQTQEKIYLYQNGNLINEILNSDLSNLNHEINYKVSILQKMVISNNFSEVESIGSEIKTLLERRQEILDKNAEPDQYLSGLYAQEARLNSIIRESKEEIYSPEDGIISYNIDGLENLLHYGSINDISIDEYTYIIDSIKNTKKRYVDKHHMRIIKYPGEMYGIIGLDFPSYNYNEGDIIEISCKNSNNNSALIKRIQGNEEKTIMLVEMDTDVKDFINTRSVEVNVTNVIEGLKVPSEAISYFEGMPGLEILKDSSTSFVPVSILGNDEGYSIIKELDGNVLTLYDQIIIR